MFEFDFKNLIDAIKALSNDGIIKDIADYVKLNTSASISIYYPNLPTKKNVLHFVIHGDKNFSLKKKSELTTFIQTKIQYEQPYSLEDEYLIILDREIFKGDVFTQRFSDGVLYNIENSKKIREFLVNHYSHLSPELKSFIEEQDEVDPNEVYECLKSNPKVYTALKRSPEKLDKITESVKKRFRDDEATSNPSLPTGTRIPVK